MNQPIGEPTTNEAGEDVYVDVDSPRPVGFGGKTYLIDSDSR